MECKPANTLARETLHIMDDKQRIALVETRTQGDDSSPEQLSRYQFANHLGSASLELDHQAKVVSYEEYTPYGRTSYQAVDKNIKVAAKRYRYTGKERDAESGLYYYVARYYAAWLGRWCSFDPVGLVGGVNLFTFVRSNPITRTDKYGLSDVRNGAHDPPKGNPQDRNDPSNYDDFESFRKGSEGPFTDEGLDQIWQAAREDIPLEGNSVGVTASNQITSSHQPTDSAPTSPANRGLVDVSLQDVSRSNATADLVNDNSEKFTISARGEFNEKFSIGAELFGVGAKYDIKKFRCKTSTLEIPSLNVRRPVYETGSKKSLTVAVVTASEEVMHGPGGTTKTKNTICITFLCFTRTKDKEGKVLEYGFEPTASASVGFLTLGEGTKIVGVARINPEKRTLQTSLRGVGSVFIPLDQGGLPSLVSAQGAEARVEVAGPPQLY